MRDGFSEYHPIVNMCFYVAVIGTAMFVMHPIFTVISVLAAVAYQIYLKGYKGVVFVVAMIPVFLATSLINPLFSHEGVTLICYLPTGNPLTLESILFGAASGLMIVTVILWFSTLNSIMTEDKILCVAGAAFPSLGMLISMVMRFVPKYTNQTKKVVRANQALKGTQAWSEADEKGNGKRTRKKHIGQSIKVFGIMATWALENSVITADSMRARGYGSTKRTSFTMYHFRLRDGILIGIIAILFIWNMGLFLTGEVKCTFYPWVQMTKAYGIGQYVYFYMPQILLCFLPVIINIKENIKWRRFQSKI